MTDTNTAVPVKTSRLVPLLVGVLFLGPLLAAMLLYYFGIGIPAGTVAHGTLLSEPRPLPQGAIALPTGGVAEFTGRWSLLYVGRGDCQDACRETLYRTRQVRRALGKEMSRVQRVFIATGGPAPIGLVEADHPDLLVLTDQLLTQRAVLNALGQFSEGDVFVADPLGNVILRFAPGTEMKAMHKDLALLLKASHIG